jgi:hypothetical protein
MGRTYDMTRDGFTLLAMGFTGDAALRFKLAYIDAFNRMEAGLRSAPPVTRKSVDDEWRHVPDRTLKLWIDLVREARITRGRAAAEALWAVSPLPPLPGPPLSAQTQAERERHQGRALTPDQEEEVRRRYREGGVSMKDLADAFGVSPMTIQRTVHRPTHH